MFKFTKKIIRKIDDSIIVLGKVQSGKGVLLTDRLPRIDIINTHAFLTDDKENVFTENLLFLSEESADLFFEKYKDWSDGKYNGILNPYICECGKYNLVYWVIDKSISEYHLIYGQEYSLYFNDVYEYYMHYCDKINERLHWNEKCDEVIDIKVVED